MLSHVSTNLVVGAVAHRIILMKSVISWTSLSSVSFWEFPGLIEVAEKAKLSTDRLRIQYEGLLSRPLLCIAMVLLAATVSLGSFRSGGIQTMVIAGLMGGFGFFFLAGQFRGF